MIKYDYVCGNEPFSRLLIKAARLLTTRFCSADMCFAADLGPDFRVWLKIQIANRSIAGCSRPFRQLLQFILLAGGMGANKDRKSTRLNSSHQIISYAVFCLKKKKKQNLTIRV